MVAFVQCYIAPDHDYMKKMQREREIKANPEKLLTEKWIKHDISKFNF